MTSLKLFEPDAKLPFSVTPNAFLDPTLLFDLIEELPIRQHYAEFGGQRVRVPRQEAWIGEEGTPAYRFGGRTYLPDAFGPRLSRVKRQVESLTQQNYQSCFVNYYATGADHIPWHSDDEPWIGPWIASVSLGENRTFQLRHKRDAGHPGARRPPVFTRPLGAGDLLVMGPGCQQSFEHRILPSERLRCGPRLNLTFRQVVA